MRNNYPGECYRCGAIVLPATGYFEKITGRQRTMFAGHLPVGKWLHQHVICYQKHRGTDHHFAIADEILVERRRRYNEDQSLLKQERYDTATIMAQSIGWPGSNPQSAIRFLKREGIKL